jgi:hypothetical protein
MCCPRDDFAQSLRSDGDAKGRIPHTAFAVYCDMQRRVPQFYRCTQFRGNSAILLALIPGSCRNSALGVFQAFWLGNTRDRGTRSSGSHLGKQRAATSLRPKPSVIELRKT